MIRCHATWRLQLRLRERIDGLDQKLSARKMWSKKFKRAAGESGAREEFQTQFPEHQQNQLRQLIRHRARQQDCSIATGGMEDTEAFDMGSQAEGGLATMGTTTKTRASAQP